MIQMAPPRRLIHGLVASVNRTRGHYADIGIKSIMPTPELCRGLYAEPSGATKIGSRYRHNSAVHFLALKIRRRIETCPIGVGPQRRGGESLTLSDSVNGANLNLPREGLRRRSNRDATKRL